MEEVTGNGQRVQELIAMCDAEEVRTVDDNGKDRARVREAVLSLLKLNIPIRAVSSAIKSNMEKLTGAKVQQLLSYETVHEITCEGKSLHFYRQGGQC